MNNDIVVLTGFTASGKTVASKELQKYGYNLAISTTSRPMRDEEQEGEDYWFISKDTFIKALEKNQFLEHRRYNVLVNDKPDIWYYGLNKNDLKDDKPYVVVLDLEGAEKIKKIYGKRVKIFFLEASEGERRRRSIARGSHDEAEFTRRCNDDKERYTSEEIYRIADRRIISLTEELTMKSLLWYLDICPSETLKG